MTSEMETLHQELLSLPDRDRLQLAQWLLKSVLDKEDDKKNGGGTEEVQNPLLAIAGKFSGGPGDTAERAEEILEAEVKAKNGFSVES